MIVTLTGNNAFGLGHELARLADEFVAEYGELALERIDGEEVSVERISEALASLPFLASRKLVVLRAPSANKQFVEQAEKLLADLPETNDVILLEPKLDKRSSYYKFIKKATDFRDFPQLDVRGLASWLAAEANARDGKLSARDAQYLAERVGPNQQLLANELEKLLSYDASITRQTIDLLSEATPQSTIFQLLEAAFAGNVAKALALYQEQRAMKVEPQQIIAMLAWQLHVLALIKTASGKSAQQTASEAKLSPYVVQKSQAIASKLALAELKTLIKNLLEIDARSKRENLDLDEALQNYLLALA